MTVTLSDSKKPQNCTIFSEGELKYHTENVFVSALSSLFLPVYYLVLSGGGGQDVFPGEEGAVSVVDGVGYFSA